MSLALISNWTKLTDYVCRLFIVKKKPTNWHFTSYLFRYLTKIPVQLPHDIPWEILCEIPLQTPHFVSYLFRNLTRYLSSYIIFCEIPRHLPYQKPNKIPQECAKIPSNTMIMTEFLLFNHGIKDNENLVGCLWTTELLVINKAADRWHQSTDGTVLPSTTKSHRPKSSFQAIEQQHPLAIDSCAHHTNRFTS